MTPQELQDMPFAGMAKEKLVAQGLWDEYSEYEWREFLVDLTAEVTIDDQVIIRARHENEAKEKAVAQFAKLHKCDKSDVETVEIRDSLEDKK